MNRTLGNSLEKRPQEYAVVMFLPPTLEQIIAPLRERFDPDYNTVAAHITLVFPFETARPLDDLSAIIKAEVEQWQPGLIQLDSIGDFYPGLPIIYWRVIAAEALQQMYIRLYSRLDLTLPFKKLVPHVTVAREISHHRVVLVKDQIAAYLPEESFEVKAVDLISPVADHQWVSVRTFAVPRT